MSMGRDTKSWKANYNYSMDPGIEAALTSLENLRGIIAQLITLCSAAIVVLASVLTKLGVKGKIRLPQVLVGGSILGLFGTILASVWGLFSIVAAQNVLLAIAATNSTVLNINPYETTEAALSAYSATRGSAINIVFSAYIAYALSGLVGLVGAVRGLSSKKED